MDRNNFLRFIGCLIGILLTVGQMEICCAAESSVDAVIDHATKEKLRRETLPTPKSQTAEEEYTIGYRDILYVSILGEGSMAAGPSLREQPEEQDEDNNFIRGRGTGAEVRVDGRMSLLHIGDVYAVGMTITQLADYLKKLYSEIYEDPRVSVTLIQSNSRNYTVMGNIIKPGVYHLDYPINIVKAIARAGGFNEWANSEVTLIRPDSQNGKERTRNKNPFIEFDYDDFLKGKHLDKNILLKSGDILVAR